jgi:tRNA G46 methylase TrmB
MQEYFYYEERFTICEQRNELIRRRGYPASIKGNYHSLYISSKPAAAKYLASQIASRDIVVIEFCCGVGITLSALAPYCKEIIGIDNSEYILAACKENLKHASNVRLILGDVTDNNLLKQIKADIAIYDIPSWKQSEMNPDLQEVV